MSLFVIILRVTQVSSSQLPQLISSNACGQILLALIAFITLIGATVNYNYTYHDEYHFRAPNGFLVMAGFWSLFSVMVLGGLGVLSHLRPQDLARYLMFIFDVLALCASIAAGIVSRSTS